MKDSNPQIHKGKYDQIWFYKKNLKLHKLTSDRLEENMYSIENSLK